MDKLRKISKKIIVTTIASIWMTIGISCENAELTRSVESDDDTEKTGDSVQIDNSINSYDNPGISFELESDSLEEQTEDVYFHPKGWEEEGMNVDL